MANEAAALEVQNALHKFPLTTAALQTYTGRSSQQIHNSSKLH